MAASKPTFSIPINLVLILLHFLIPLSIAIGLGELRLKFWRQETDSNCHPKDLQSCALTSFAILPMERIVRIELTSSAWKAEVIAIIRYPQTNEPDLNTETIWFLEFLPTLLCTIIRIAVLFRKVSFQSLPSSGT